VKSPLVSELSLQRTFNAPRERVFRAWSDPELLKLWLGGHGVKSLHARVDFRVGGMYEMDMQVPTDAGIQRLCGIYQEIKAPEKLVFTWSWGDKYSADDATLVTVTFIENDGKTTMTLKHERFDSAPARDMHIKGWDMCVNRLVNLFP